MADNDKVIELTHDDLREMPRNELNALLLKATKIKGTAVVRRADGSIKYDQGVNEDGTDTAN